MILLYTLLLLLLVAVKVLTERRAAALERRFSRTAAAAEKLVREPVYKAGNSSLMDPYKVAKRQFQLGLLIQKRDHLEGKYMAWQRRADRCGKMVEAVRAWKGRKLPYTFGALDVSVLFGLIDYLGAGHYIGVRRVIELVTALWAN